MRAGAHEGPPWSRAGVGGGPRGAHTHPTPWPDMLVSILVSILVPILVSILVSMVAVEWALSRCWCSLIKWDLLAWV